MSVITVLGRTVGTSNFPGSLVRELRAAAERTERADKAAISADAQPR